MSKADSATKAFLSNPEVFAEAFNVGLFDGKHYIDPRSIREVDTAEIAVAPSRDESHAKLTDFVQKQRDILKMATVMESDAAYLVLLGLENQRHVDYCMPVRNFLYDALTLEKQRRVVSEKYAKKENCKELSEDEYICRFSRSDKIKPVITLVVNWSGKPWDGPLTLRDMYDCPEDWILQYAPDYRVNLLDPMTLPDEKLTKFQSELKPVFAFAKYQRDKQELRSAMETRPELFSEIGSLAADVIFQTTGVNLKRRKKEEAIDMCNAVQEMCDDARAEGQEDIILKFAQKFSAEEIASVLEKPLSDIQQILDKHRSN